MTQDNIHSIGQIAIAVSDIKASLSFYCDVLGLEILFEAPPNLAFLHCGDIRLMLTTLQGEPQDHHTSVIYYKVDHIQDFCSNLTSHDVTITREPELSVKMPDHDLWLAFIRDPDQNLIGIMSEISHE